jgi:O-antigen/teichoic acid export membrane protein
MVVGLFVGIWVARYLGPKQFGLLSYVQSFVGLFTVVATLGLDSIVIRELVKDQSRNDQLLRTVFLLKLIGAFGVLLTLALAINFTSNDSYINALVFIIASASIFHSFNVIDLYFQSRVLSKYVVFANIISLCISSILKVSLILHEAPLEAFAWVVLFDSFILASGLIYFYFVKNPDNHQALATLPRKLFVFEFNAKIAISLMKDSWPLILSGMVVAIYMRVDQVMIKEMMNAAAVGQYAAAVRLSEVWYFIPMVITSSLFPAMINAKNQNESIYYVRLQRLYDLIVWIAIAIAIPMTFLSDWIVTLLFGEQYSQAGGVLMVHFWAGIFVAFSFITSKHINIINRQSLTMIATLIGAVSNVILNFVLIKKFGVVGAAYATLISYALTNYLILFFFKDLRKLFFMINKSIFVVTRKQAS